MMMLHRQVFGAGPDLLLLHGWGMNGAIWSEVAAQLANQFRVTILDLPGHGNSQETDLITLEHWAQCCLEAAPEFAIWLGWSLGGSLALQAAFMQPARIKALLLITATPRFLRCADWPYGMAEDTLARFNTALIADVNTTLERFLSLQVQGSVAASTVLRTLRRQLAQAPQARVTTLRAGLDLLRNTDLRAQLKELHIPNLWLYGQRDTLVPARSAEYVAQLLPTARIHTLAGAAHAPFLSHQESALSLLRTFIAELK